MTEPLSVWDPANLAIGTAMVLGFWLFLFVLTRFVPGKRQKGAKLADGSRLTYTLNGLTLFLITAATIAGAYALGLFSLAAVHRHFWGVLVGANLLSIVVTLALYALGKRKKNAANEGLIKDLWYGVELNPNWLGVDVKLFSYKPSLIGLAILNATFAVVQYESRGELTTQMICYQAFTFIYVFNYFQFEYGMLYTWDIVEERFGFMLVWGDYALVPFLYSIVGWYLVDQTHDIPAWMAVALSAMFALGLWIFRGANQQKDEFKRDPSVKIWGKPAETLGGKILVSGFWGVGRKLNYTGEIMLYWSFTLLAGFESFVPYLLPTWLICLLVHRAWRDDKRCRAKYGALWEQYCRRATFKMVPFIY
jgi:delta14-sterol reductase